MSNTNHSGAARAVDSSRLLPSDQIALEGLNPDGSCRCRDEKGYCKKSPKRRGKHPTNAAYKEGDNIGNLTGQEHGRIVIDVDVREGDGFAELRAIAGYCAEDLEATYMVETASGGAHYYFRHPGGRVGNGKLADHVDVRGDKSRDEGQAYAVAPGSQILKADGSIGSHRVKRDLPLAVCPAWLHAALLGRKSTSGAGFAVEPVEIPEGDTRRVRQAENYLETVNPLSIEGKGGRNVFYGVCATLTRKMRLPIEVAADCIERIYNPRLIAACTTPWEGEELYERLESARTTSSVPAGDVDDGSSEAWVESMRARRDAAKSESSDPAIETLKLADPKPCVTLDEDLYSAVVQGCAALQRSDEVYQRELKLVQVVRSVGSVDWARGVQGGIPIVREMPTALLASELTRVAAWRKWDGRAKNLVATQPPERVVNAIASATKWPGVRPLRGIAEAPFLRPDASVCQAPGYDPTTALIFDPAGCAFPEIPEAPTHADAERALVSLLEPFEEFPFENDVDRLIPIALVLTSLGRGALIGANVPCFVFDAPVQGTGKTLCVDLTAWILTGRAVPKHTFPENKEELEKVLGGAALDGARLLCFDNVNTTFGGDALESRITCNGSSQFRTLGKSGNPVLPWDCIVSATANNIRCTLDMRRRSLRCRMVSPFENPEQRPILRKDLKGWVLQRRPALIAAGLTILRAYVVAGRPHQKTREKGGFEEWSSLVAGALMWTIGIDIVAAEMPKTSADDQATEAYAAFLAAAELGKEMTAKDIARMPCWDDLIIPKDSNRNARVGGLLKKMQDRPLNGRKVVLGAKDTHAKVNTYKVVAA